MTSIAGIAFVGFPNAEDGENAIQQEVVSGSSLEPVRIDNEGAGLAAVMEAGDARAQIVANFLERHGSPLQPYDYYGEFLVGLADKYGLDFRFLPAIMMEESNLCRVTPTTADGRESYNCLGLGVHARGVWGFNSYEENLEAAANILKKNYIDQGRKTTRQVAEKYTASVDKWTNSVNQWMAEMRYDDRSLGIKKKTNANVVEFATESGELQISPIAQ